MEKLIRGDYLPFHLQIKNEDGKVKEEKVDEAIFWLKESKYSNEPLIEKKLSTNEITYNETDKSYHFSFSPDETKSLNYDNEYFFAVKVFVDKEPYTIVRGVMTFDWEGVFVYQIGDKNG